MTQTELTGNTIKPKANSYFFTNYFYKIKSNFKFMIILFILHFVAAPLNIFNTIIFSIKEANNPDYNSYTMGFYLIIGILGTAIAAIAGIIIAINIFSYLHKKSSVDMVLSLPLSTDQRFFSDFLAGLTIYLAPFIATSIISVIIHGIAALTCEPWRLIIADASNSLNSGILGQFLLLVLFGLAIMLMIYVLAVLVTTCCGSFFETIAHSFIINGLIPGAILTIGYLLFGNLYGIDYTDSVLPLLKITSPIGGITAIITQLESFDNLGNFGGLILSWLIPFLAITILYFAISYFLYKKRKAEQVSKPIVYKIFYYIVITSITFCMGVLFIISADMGGDFSSIIIPMIITTAIVYLIIEVITNRGFKKFWMSAIRYGITIVSVVIVVSVVNSTNGFGIVKSVPSASSVKSIDFTAHGLYNLYQGRSPFTITDPDSINKIIFAHEKIVKNYNTAIEPTDTMPNNEYSSDDFDENPIVDYITLKYHLKNGSTMLRTYDINFDIAYDLREIALSDEYIKQIMDNLRYYAESASNYESIYIELNSNIGDAVDGSWFSQNVDVDTMNSLINAVESDLMGISTEEFYTPTKNCLGTISLYGWEFQINENYVNTLAFLNKIHFEFPKIDNEFISNLKGDCRISPPSLENVGTLYNGKKYTYSHCITATTTLLEFSADFEYDNPYLSQILEVAQPNYISSEPCYSLTINGNIYIIPAEYTSLAENFYKECLK